jgi:hypothetical protein
MSEKTSDNCLKMSEKLSDKKYNCTKCNKQFNNRKTKWSHEKKCIVEEQNSVNLVEEQRLSGSEMNDNTLKVENAKLKEKVEIFEKEIDTMKGQMLELMNKICKIHPKTLTKINKQLNNTMINNNNNNTINNYNIVQLGRENLSEIFCFSSHLHLCILLKISISSFIKTTRAWPTVCEVVTYLKNF